MIFYPKSQDKNQLDNCLVNHIQSQAALLPLILSNEIRKNQQAYIPTRFIFCFWRLWSIRSTVVFKTLNNDQLRQRMQVFCKFLCWCYIIVVPPDYQLELSNLQFPISCLDIVDMKNNASMYVGTFRCSRKAAHKINWDNSVIVASVELCCQDFGQCRRPSREQSLQKSI